MLRKKTKSRQRSDGAGRSSKTLILNRISALAALVLMITCSPGCMLPYFRSGLGGGVVAYGPGGAPEGELFGDVTYPNILNPSTNHEIRFTNEDVEVIGAVDTEASSFSVLLGLISWGDSGYGSLVEQAKEMGGDGVMNLSVDTRYSRFGITRFLTLFGRVQSELQGVVYRYKNKAKSPSAQP
ncbi:MAG: hypothetical protein KJ645_10195 [Planctomycetes bacterium]|nr:hypothetical protein [Planctomycetota bacterium]